MNSTATSECAFGKPVQIYYKVRGRGVLDVRAFERIVRPLASAPCLLVSINGSKRTGKSFLLNNFIRQLEQNEFRDSNVAPPDGGFAWRGGDDSVTDGAWLWSRAYHLKKGAGDPGIHILLMDTQGSFDSESDFEEDARMFGISARLSSVFVYNVQGRLDEEAMTFLAKFTEQATPTSGGFAENDSKVFHNFVLLMRDWSSPKAYHYGLHECSRFVDNSNDDQLFFVPNDGNFMEDNFLIEGDCKAVGGTTECARRMRRLIRDSCETMSAFLMPHPGEEVATNEDGETCYVDPRFEEEVRNLFGHVFGQGATLGAKTTGQDLLSTVADIGELLNMAAGSGLGEKDGRFFTAELLMEDAVNLTLKSYRQEVLNFGSRDMESFSNFAVDLAKKSRASFQQIAAKFERPDLSVSAMDNLITKMAADFANFKLVLLHMEPLVQLHERYGELDTEINAAWAKSIEKNQRVIELEQQLSDKTLIDFERDSVERNLDDCRRTVDRYNDFLVALHENFDEFNKENWRVLMKAQILITLAISGLTDSIGSTVLQEFEGIIEKIHSIKEALEQMAKEAQDYQAKCRKGRVACMSTSATSTALGVIGLAIIPVTAGLGPIITTAIGLGLGVMGDSANAGIAFANIGFTKNALEETKTIIEGKNRMLKEIESKMEAMVEGLAKQDLPFIRNLGTTKSGRKIVSKAKLTAQIVASSYKATYGVYSSVTAIRLATRLASETGATIASESTAAVGRVSSRVALSIAGLALGACLNAHTLYKFIRDRNRNHPVTDFAEELIKSLEQETELYLLTLDEYRVLVSETLTELVEVLREDELDLIQFSEF